MILLYLIFSKFDATLFMQSAQIWPPLDDVTQLTMFECTNPCTPWRIHCIRSMLPLENFFLQIRNIISENCLGLVTPFINGYFIVRNFYLMYNYTFLEIGVDAFTYGNLLAKEHFEFMERVTEALRHIEFAERNEQRPIGKYLVLEFGFAVVYAEYAVRLFIIFYVYTIYEHYRPFVDGPGAPWVYVSFLYLLNYIFLGFLCYLFPCGMCYTYTDYIFLTVVSYVSIIGFFVAFPVAFLYLGYRHLSSKQTVVEVPDEFMYSFARNLYTSDASDVRALRPPHVNRDINIAKQAQQQTHAKANKDKMRQRIKDIKHTEDEMPSREPPY